MANRWTGSNGYPMHRTPWALRFLRNNVVSYQREQALAACDDFVEGRLRLDKESCEFLWRRLRELDRLRAETMLKHLKQTYFDYLEAEFAKEEGAETKSNAREHKGVPVFDADELIALMIDLLQVYVMQNNSQSATNMLYEMFATKMNYHEVLLEALKTNEKYRNQFLEFVRLVRENELNFLITADMMRVIVPEMFRMWIYLSAAEDPEGVDFDWFVREMKQMDILPRERQDGFCELMIESWVSSSTDSGFDKAVRFLDAMKREFGTPVEETFYYYYSQLQLLGSEGRERDSDSLAKQLEIAEELYRQNTLINYNFIRVAALVSWIRNDRVDRVEEQLKLLSPTDLNEFVYYALIEMWHRLGDNDKLCETFVQSHQAGFPQSLQAYNYFLSELTLAPEEAHGHHHHDKSGKYTTAKEKMKKIEKLLRVMETCNVKPNLETYQTLLWYYSDRKEMIDALLQQMMSQNIAPDTYVFNLLISSADANDVKKRSQLLDVMSKNNIPFDSGTCSQALYLCHFPEDQSTEEIVVRVLQLLDYMETNKIPKTRLFCSDLVATWLRLDLFGRVNEVLELLVDKERYTDDEPLDEVTHRAIVNCLITVDQSPIHGYAESPDYLEFLYGVIGDTPLTVQELIQNKLKDPAWMDVHLFNMLLAYMAKKKNADTVKELLVIMNEHKIHRNEFTKECIALLGRD